MEWPLLRTLSVALGLLLEVVAKRRGVIFGTDDILARDNLDCILLRLERTPWAFNLFISSIARAVSTASY